MLNPDGKFCDTDRARQRGFTWCAQRADGMSIGKLIASPELRANLDAWLARFAAPGLCNPDDQTPSVSEPPSDERARTDLRSHTQRQHDALNALVRNQLGDPKLGVHNGLPVTVTISTTLQELTDAAGYAVTAAGTMCRCATSSAWPATPSTNWPCSTTTKAARCIWAAPNASPHPTNASCYTPKNARVMHC